MNKISKMLAVTLPLTFCLQSGVAGAADQNIGTLVAGGNGPFYEVESMPFSDKYSFDFNFGSAFSGANVNIQYADLLVGSHSIPDLSASLYDSGNNFLGILSGDNANNNFGLSNGSYYLNIAGTPLPALDINGATFGVHFEVTPVPEPETYALMLGGLALVGFSARRRKTKSEA